MKKSFFLKAFSCVIFILAICTATAVSSRIIFNKKSRAALNQVSRIKDLEFSSNLDGQLLLATKMAKSPLISAYMENPRNDYLFKTAMEEILSYQEAFKGKNTFSISDTDLRYYSNGKYLYTLDKNAGGSEWFSDCLSVPEDYTFNVSYEAALKKSMLWINAVVRDKNKKGIGLIGTGVDLSDFVDMMYQNLEDGISMFMYNKNLEITGAEDTDLLERKAKITELMPQMRSFEPFPSEKTFYKASSGAYILSPVPSVGWTMVLFIPFTVKEFIQCSLAPLAAILIAIFAAAAFITIKKFINPLAAMNQAVTDFSSGNADLTKRLESSSSKKKGLIWKIEKGFNAFIEKLQQIVAVIKNSRNELFSSLKNLRSSIHGIQNSIEEINTHIDGMELSIKNQAESINSASGAVDQISSKISELNGMIFSQNENVAEASASVAQMIGSIESVTASISKLSESFASLETNAGEGADKQQEVNARISEIKSQSEMLQDANLIISSIASQTNLLAMNAAIEAAHAGEAGKGFSVVADEIRKLSETSSAQSKTIGQQLKAIQDSISEIFYASDESQKVLHSVVENIHSTDALVQSIRNAMEEQKQGSAQINKALSSLKDNSEEVKNASSETEKKNKSILDEAKKLHSSSENIRKRMNSMTGCARAITSEAEKLGSLSDNVDASLDKISSEIDLFKV